MSQAQSIQIAYVILWRTTVFKHALREWNALPAVQKTWINFKTRFCQAVREYCQLKGPTVNDSIYQQQHANLVHQMKEELCTTIAEEKTIMQHISTRHCTLLPQQMFLFLIIWRKINNSCRTKFGAM